MDSEEAVETMTRNSVTKEWLEKMAACVVLALGSLGWNEQPAEAKGTKGTGTAQTAAVTDGLSLGLRKTEPSRDRVPDPSPIPEGYEYWKTVTAKVTAYEPSWRSCGRYADGRTSIGRNAWRTDGCAADPRAIPYGTLVEIPDVGLRRMDDTGGALRRSWRRGRYHVDVRMTYVWQARRWGVKRREIKLYRKKGG